MRPTPLPLILGLVAAAVIVVATFLPWQETPLNGEVSGFGSGGWATMVLGLIAAFNLLTWRITGKRRDALVGAAVGGAAIIAAGYLLYDFSTRTEGLFDESMTSDPLVGGYVALSGAIVLTAAALVLALRSSEPQRAPAPQAGTGAPSPPPPPPPPR